jgi:hypothetical protein
MVVRERFSYNAIYDVLSGLLEQDLHAKRVNSCCDASLGVLHSARWRSVRLVTASLPPVVSNPSMRSSRACPREGGGRPVAVQSGDQRR